jgi:hypothetical protein
MSNAESEPAGYGAQRISYDYLCGLRAEPIRAIHEPYDVQGQVERLTRS